MAARTQALSMIYICSHKVILAVFAPLNQESVEPASVFVFCFSHYSSGRATGVLPGRVCTEPYARTLRVWWCGRLPDIYMSLGCPVSQKVHSSVRPLIRPRAHHSSFFSDSCPPNLINGAARRRKESPLGRKNKYRIYLARRSPRRRATKHKQRKAVAREP